MGFLEENIKRINAKLQQLLKQHQLLQKENEQLKLSVSDLKLNQQTDLKKIDELEQQIAILKSAAGKMNEADKKMYEKQINHYIREIDKCIGLLSE